MKSLNVKVHEENIGLKNCDTSYYTLENDDHWEFNDYFLQKHHVDISIAKLWIRIFISANNLIDYISVIRIESFTIINIRGAGKLAAKAATKHCRSTLSWFPYSSFFSHFSVTSFQGHISLILRPLNSLTSLFDSPQRYLHLHFITHLFPMPFFLFHSSPKSCFIECPIYPYYLLTLQRLIPHFQKVTTPCNTRK